MSPFSWLRTVAVTLLLGVGAWAVLRPGAGAVPAVPPSPSVPGGAVAGAPSVLLPPGVSRGWWAEARREIEAGQEGFSPRPVGEAQGWALAHAGAGITGSFDGDGYTLEPIQGDWIFRLTLKAMGREGRMRPVSDVAPEASGGRVRFKRGNVEEWYRSVRGGIEQGFDIAARPEGEGPLVILQALETTLDPGKAGPGGLTLCLGGAEVLSYRDLKAWDAGGRELKAWMAHGPGELRLVVEDAAASYPLRIDPLSTSVAWNAESDQAGAQHGFSVAVAGDVNGDGYLDVVVGAPYYDNGQTDEGRVHVYHGSSTGISDTANWTAEGNQSTATFGTSVAGAGDVNGDGYADVVVGAPLYDNGQADEGRAFVFHGSATGLPASADWSVEVNDAGADFGISVAGAGDVNGDGYADVIVGADFYDAFSALEGSAFLYHGSSSGLPASHSSLVWDDVGLQTLGRFGAAVASAGDVDGDGYDDVAVGAPDFDNGQTDEGRVFVFHGSRAGLAVQRNWTAEINQSTAAFGKALAHGDVNGDGYDDLAVGAPFVDNGHTDEGRTSVFHGSSAGLLTASTDIEANRNNAQAGSTLSFGDVNGDGYADLVIGGPYATSGQTQEGFPAAYHGSASSLISQTQDWVVQVNQSTANFGYSVSAGDLNGDGFSDVVVGARLYDNGEADEGRAYVYHSNDTTTYNTYNLPGKRLILNPGAGDLLDPSVSRVARDSNGYWYLAWSAGRATDILLSYTTTSTPTQATDWATITLVDNGGTGVIAAAPANNASGAVPAIALSADDQLHLAWQKVSTADYYWTTCTSLTAIDDSASWGAPIQVDSVATASEALRGLDLAVDRSGTVHLTYTSGSTALRYAKYDSGAGSFYTGVELVGTTAVKPRLAIDLDQNVYVIYHDNVSPYDIHLLCTTNAFSDTPANSVWKNLGQTTTDPDTVNNANTELPAGGSAALVVDMNGICHVAWRTGAGESPSAGLVARAGMINLGWETGPTTLDATVFWKPPVSLTSMGNGDVYLFAVAGSVTGGSRRDAVCTIKYTAPTTYRTFGSWDLSGDPVYTETSDLRAGGSQGLWTDRLAPRNRTDAMWFVANDAQHAISTSYTDRISADTLSGWRPPAMSSAGFHPHYVYAFPNTDVDLGSMPLPVVSQTALKGAVYMADSSSTGHVYAIDRATGILARSYTLGGTAEFITSASYAGNVHLFVHQAANQLLKLTDLGASITFDAAWSNNPRTVNTSAIRVPPIFIVEGGTRYLYLTDVTIADIASGRLDKLYADNGNRVAGFTAGTAYASTYTEQTLRALNDQIFIAGGTNKIYRRDADGTGEISSSVIANVTKHVILVRDGNNLFLAPEDNWVWRLTSGLATSTWTSGKSSNIGGAATQPKTSAAHYTSGTGSIYVGRTNVLYRLNATDGTEISSWAQPTAGNIVTPPVLWSTYVYFGTDTGELFAVDQATNVARANWPITLDSTNGVPVVRTIAFDGSFGHVYFSTSEGRVYKFSLE